VSARETPLVTGANGTLMARMHARLSMADSGVMNDGEALLGVCREALQSVDGQLVSSAREDLSAPAEDSLYRRERAELAGSRVKAQSQVWKKTLDVSELILANLTDHVRALNVLLGSGYPLYAHGGLARVAFEAELRLGYLLDHRVDLDTRLLRGAATLLYSARQDVLAASEMLPNVRALPKGERYLQRKLERFRTLLRNAGMTETKKVISWADGRAEQIILNITDLAKDVGGLPGFYRLSSGLAHSGLWMLDDLPLAGSGTKEPVPDPVNVGGLVDATITVCMRATEVHARYYGHDFVTYNSQIKRHRKHIEDEIAKIMRARWS
jgi:hypothetical protein